MSIAIERIQDLQLREAARSRVAISWRRGVGFSTSSHGPKPSTQFRSSVVPRMAIVRTVLPLRRKGKIMAQLVVRNRRGVKKQLRRRAIRHGRSMEDEVRDILRNAVKDEGRAVGRLGSEIAALFDGIGLDTDIAELRGSIIVATFD